MEFVWLVRAELTCNGEGHPHHPIAMGPHVAIYNASLKGGHKRHTLENPTSLEHLDFQMDMLPLRKKLRQRKSQPSAHQSQALLWNLQ